MSISANKHAWIRQHVRAIPRPKLDALMLQAAREKCDYFTLVGETFLLRKPTPEERDLVRATLFKEFADQIEKHDKRKSQRANLRYTKRDEGKMAKSDASKDKDYMLQQILITLEHWTSRDPALQQSVDAACFAVDEALRRLPGPFMGALVVAMTAVNLEVIHHVDPLMIPVAIEHLRKTAGRSLTLAPTDATPEDIAKLRAAKDVPS